MRKIAVISLLLLSLFISAAAEAGDNVLHLVTSLNPLEAKEYISAFEEETSIKVNWIRLSAGEVLARLKTEGKHTTQSVWFGGPLPEFIAAKKDGLLQPYVSPRFKKLPKKWFDPEGYWTGIYYGYIGFVSNNAFLQKHNLTPPQSWQDLLNPIYKDRVTISYPYTAGTGFTIFAGLVSEFGLAGAIAYWKKLDKLVHHYTKSGSAPILEVGLGEAAVGVCFSQDILRKGTMRKFPVTLSFPRDGVPFEVGGAAIIKGAPELKLAKRFIDWIVSKNAQDLMHVWARVPLLASAKVRKDMKKPSDMKLIEMDFFKLGEIRTELITHWRNELKQ